MIAKINSVNCHKMNMLKYNSHVTFGNKISIPQNKVFIKLEKTNSKLDLKLRKMLNSVLNFLHKESAKNIKNSLNLEERSAQFTYTFYDYCKKLSSNKVFLVNTEQNALINIAKSKDACIFIMNHDKQMKDPKTLVFFNALLSREYLLNKKASKCPQSKIILNENILNAKNKEICELLEKLGAVGIDSSLFAPDLRKNVTKILPLVKNFIENKNNIFIFPEGEMCLFKHWDIKYKFQTGVAELVNKIAAQKGEVKIVPLGFAYKKKLSSIYIGNPVFIKKDSAITLFSKGNSDSAFFDKKLADFCNKTPKDFSPITKNGIPIENKNVSDYIAGILCENLRACKSEAKNAFSKKENIEDSVIYAL